MYQLLQGLKYLHEKMISHRGAFDVPPLSQLLIVLTDLKAIIFCAFVLPSDFFPPQPENILLHCPGPYPRILIADFGLARPNSYQETFNVCGTVSYLPPEGILALDNKHLGYIGYKYDYLLNVFKLLSFSSMPADCWSAGVILYIMLWYVSGNF